MDVVRHGRYGALQARDILHGDPTRLLPRPTGGKAYGTYNTHVRLINNYSLIFKGLIITQMFPLPLSLGTTARGQMRGG